MSTNYKCASEVPMQILIDRLRELSDAVTAGRDIRDKEFTMRIPAEVDRDADVVLDEAAKRLALLSNECQYWLKEIINDKWKDIESAPMDGTEVIIGWWEDWPHLKWRQEIAPAGNLDTGRPGERFHHSMGTHWQPCPKPPS